MCCGCGACLNVCPQKCIVMEQDDEGFVYPKINQMLCIDCHKCQKSCPFQQELSSANAEACYAAYNKDTEIRMKSSSGAIFPALAMKILYEKGVVYGSAFTKNFKQVVVQSAETASLLEELYGSKYLQSDTGSAYQMVKKHLLEGKSVLFSGTPCQISGLKYYLGKNYNNLYCIDLICHGTPSPALWRKYTDYIEKKYEGKISAINFRCKEPSWTDFGMKEQVAKTWIYTSKTDNPYMIMFLKNYCLRPSCYACKMKGHSVADLTIGDFWGVNEVFPDLNDEKGVSSVIVRNEKGQQLFKEIEDAIVVRSCTYEDIVRKNSAEKESVPFPIERKNFFVDMKRLTFPQMEKKYAGFGLKYKIKIKLRRFDVHVKMGGGND